MMLIMVMVIVVLMVVVFMVVVFMVVVIMMMILMGFGLQQQVAAVQAHPSHLLVYARRIAVTLLMCSTMCSSTSNSQLMKTIYTMLMRCVRRKKDKSLSKQN